MLHEDGIRFAVTHGRAKLSSGCGQETKWDDSSTLKHVANFAGICFSLEPDRTRKKQAPCSY